MTKKLPHNNLRNFSLNESIFFQISTFISSNNFDIVFADTYIKSNLNVKESTLITNEIEKFRSKLDRYNVCIILPSIELNLYDGFIKYILSIQNNHIITIGYNSYFCDLFPKINTQYLNQPKSTDISKLFEEDIDVNFLIGKKELFKQKFKFVKVNSKIDIALNIINTAKQNQNAKIGLFTEDIELGLILEEISVNYGIDTINMLNKKFSSEALNFMKLAFYLSNTAFYNTAILRGLSKLPIDTELRKIHKEFNNTVDLNEKLKINCDLYKIIGKTTPILPENFALKNNNESYFEQIQKIFGKIENDDRERNIIITNLNCIESSLDICIFNSFNSTEIEYKLNTTNHNYSNTKFINYISALNFLINKQTILFINDKSISILPRWIKTILFILEIDESNNNTYQPAFEIKDSEKFIVKPNLLNRNLSIHNIYKLLYDPRKYYLNQILKIDSEEQINYFKNKEKSLQISLILDTITANPFNINQDIVSYIENTSKYFNELLITAGHSSIYHEYLQTKIMRIARNFWEQESILHKNTKSSIINYKFSKPLDLTNELTITISDKIDRIDLSYDDTLNIINSHIYQSDSGDYISQNTYFQLQLQAQLIPNGKIDNLTYKKIRLWCYFINLVSCEINLKEIPYQAATVNENILPPLRKIYTEGLKLIL